MGVFDDLKAEVRADLNRATDMGKAVAALALACEEVANFGFKVESERRFGLVHITVDLSAYNIAIEQIGEEEEAFGDFSLMPGVTPEAAPEPEPVADIIEPVAEPAPAVAEPPEPVAEPVAPAPDEAAEPSAVGAAWTAEDDDTFVEMIAAGQSIEEVATALNRSVTATKHRRYNKLRERINARLAASSEPVVTPQPARAPLRPAPEPSETSPLTVAQRAIDAHLNSVGYALAWTAEKDFLLARMLARGDGAAAAAEALARSKPEIIARWSAINTDNGSIEHQKNLLVVLAHRAGTAKADAA